MHFLKNIGSLPPNQYWQLKNEIDNINIENFPWFSRALLSKVRLLLESESTGLEGEKLVLVFLSLAKINSLVESENIPESESYRLLTAEGILDSFVSGKLLEFWNSVTIPLGK